MWGQRAYMSSWHLQPYLYYNEPMITFTIGAIVGFFIGIFFSIILEKEYSRWQSKWENRDGGHYKDSPIRRP